MHIVTYFLSCLSEKKNRLNGINVYVKPKTVVLQSLMLENWVTRIQKFYLLHYKQQQIVMNQWQMWKPWLCWPKCTAACALYALLPHFNAQFSPSMLLEIADILHQTFPHLPDTFTEAHRKCQSLFHTTLFLLCTVNFKKNLANLEINYSDFSM